MFIFLRYLYLIWIQGCAKCRLHWALLSLNISFLYCLLKFLQNFRRQYQNWWTYIFNFHTSPNIDNILGCSKLDMKATIYESHLHFKLLFGKHKKGWVNFCTRPKSAINITMYQGGAISSTPFLMYFFLEILYTMFGKYKMEWILPYSEIVVSLIKFGPNQKLPSRRTYEEGSKFVLLRILWFYKF